MTDLSIFKYADIDIRTVVIGGEPWVVGRDVCTVLEIAKPESSLALLDEDERGTHSVGTPGGPQDMTVVNESGLYSLILRSRKPEAKKFKRWITHEVLPAIRKTGRYAEKGYAEMRTLAPASTAAETTEILRMLGAGVELGLLDKNWAIGKARLRAARVMGEEPELPVELIPLYVPDFLKAKGLKAKDINSVQSWFGRRCVEMGEANGLDVPEQRLTEQTNGTMRPTRAWQQRHLPLFEMVWDTYYAEKYAVPMVLELGGAA